MVENPNTLDVLRRIDGRLFVARAVYSEDRADWTILLFEGSEVIAGCTSTQPFSDIPDMISAKLAGAIAASRPEADQPDRSEPRRSFARPHSV